jgi:hypothetical protein
VLEKHLKETKEREAEANATVNAHIQKLALFENQLLQKFKGLMSAFYEWQEKSESAFTAHVEIIKDAVEKIVEESDLGERQVDLVGKVSEYTDVNQETQGKSLDHGKDLEENTIENADTPLQKTVGHKRTGSDETLVDAPVVATASAAAKCAIAMKGGMQRHISNYFKKDEYKSGIYVLTETGFLHAFDWDQDHRVVGEARSSFYLPEYTVSEKDGHFLIQDRLKTVRVCVLSSLITHMWLSFDVIGHVLTSTRVDNRFSLLKSMMHGVESLPSTLIPLLLLHKKHFLSFHCLSFSGWLPF